MVSAYAYIGERGRGGPDTQRGTKNEGGCGRSAGQVKEKMANVVSIYIHTHIYI